MKRKLKALGLALFAVLAMGALSASAASAVTFNSEDSHTNIKGEQVGEDIFTFRAGTVKCQEATYAGTQSGTTATTMRVSPTYTECTAFGFKATVDVGTCEYEFSSDDNEMDIVNCGSTPITITAFNCWVTVGNQNGLKSVAYTNEGSGSSSDIRLVLSMKENIIHTQHSKSFPGCKNGTFSDGSYTGVSTVKGFNTEGKQVGIARL